jgi:hypothetical protein
MFLNEKQMFMMASRWHRFCSITQQGGNWVGFNEIEIAEGIKRVKDAISERIVRADRGELIKSNLKKPDARATRRCASTPGREFWRAPS